MGISQKIRSRYLTIDSNIRDNDRSSSCEINNEFSRLVTLRYKNTLFFSFYEMGTILQSNTYVLDCGRLVKVTAKVN